MLLKRKNLGNHKSYWKSDSIFEKMNELSNHLIVIIFRYLHSFTPKNGVKVGQYSKNSDF